MAMDKSSFSIGNTSSFLVHFPASHVSLPEGNSHFATKYNLFVAKKMTFFSVPVGKSQNLSGITQPAPHMPRGIRGNNPSPHLVVCRPVDLGSKGQQKNLLAATFHPQGNSRPYYTPEILTWNLKMMVKARGTSFSGDFFSGSMLNFGLTKAFLITIVPFLFGLSKWDGGVPYCFFFQKNPPRKILLALFNGGGGKNGPLNKQNIY